MLIEALPISKEGVITIVGAGGKTSLLLSLAAEFRQQKRVFLLTTTTKMFFNQVRGYFPVFTRDFECGRERVGKYLAKCGCAGLFRSWRETKVDGIPPEWVDALYTSGLVRTILVEGDGARRKLLKAPGENEPVIPLSTDMVVGVLSLKAVGQEFSPRIVHRAEIAAQILGKDFGDTLEYEDLGHLAGDARGIFGSARGKKALVLTGGEKGLGVAEKVGKVVKNLGQIDLTCCLVTEGYGEGMKIVEEYLF